MFKNSIYFRVFDHDNLNYESKLNRIEYQKPGSLTTDKLYFCHINDINYFLHVCDSIIDITFPVSDSDFNVIIEDRTYKVNKININNEYFMYDLKAIQYMEDLGVNINRNIVLQWAIDKLYWEVIIFLIMRMPMSVSRCEMILKLLKQSKNKYDLVLAKNIIFFATQLLTLYKQIINKIKMSIPDNFKRDKNITKFLMSDQQEILPDIGEQDDSVINLLLTAKQDVKQMGLIKSVFYALYSCALDNSNFDIIKEFILLDKNSHIYRYENSRALRMAVEKRNYDFVDFLISIGEKITAGDNCIIEAAFVDGDFDKIKQLLLLCPNIKSDIDILGCVIGYYPNDSSNTQIKKLEVFKFLVSLVDSTYTTHNYDILLKTIFLHSSRNEIDNYEILKYILDNKLCSNSCLSRIKNLYFDSSEIKNSLVQKYFDLFRNLHFDSSEIKNSLLQ
ncbi:putative ankyrin repeat protein [Cotonvirus japonicus]|uniref:Ankyrin repeat protein n=1 Tax=Cotonvirus japonicus TaxID=2811091 RepID=A0ABM7NRE3_9VIRU|nr:putative ankyrin repeat protein [Cotonvirus japonicus]BCS82714.1 putative ankyrin repeat protein [Cotonvirus japonicus]